MLYKRYASPFSLLDQMIEQKSLNDYITFVWEAKQEEQEWDFYLHKDHSNMSFEDFKQSLKDTAQNQIITKQVLETAVNDSFDMLNNFVPNDERGETM